MASRKRGALTTAEVSAAVLADSDDNSFEEDDADRESDALSDHEPDGVATMTRDSCGVVDTDVDLQLVCDEVEGSEAEAAQDSDADTVIYDYHSQTVDSDSSNTSDPTGWQRIGAGYQVPKDIVFTGSHGIMDTSGLSADSKPVDIFLSLVTPQIIELITDETNRYATVPGAKSTYIETSQ